MMRSAADRGGEEPAVRLRVRALGLIAERRQTAGRYGASERLYRRALEIKEKVLGGGHPDTALTLHNLATLLAGSSRTAEAEALYGRALAVFESALGKTHPHTAVCREGLAALGASFHG